MPIIDVQQRYRELGRLRMGDLEGRRPIRLETWRMTSPAQELLDKAAGLWGGQVTEWSGAPTEGTQYELVTEATTLPVLVPPQDIDAGQFMELWTAGGCKRRCDGQTEFLSGRACICAAKDERLCKPTTQLLVMLPDIPDIGVWRVRTLGWNAAAEIPQTVHLLAKVAGRGVYPEATLAIEPRTSKTDGETHHYVVPVLRLPFTLAAMLDASPAAAEITTGRRELVPLPGRRPELPADPTFADETDPSWGDEAVLAEDAPTEEAASREQVVKLHAIAGELGWDDATKHESAGVESLNHLSKERASALIEDWTARLAIASVGGEVSETFGEGVTGAEPPATTPVQAPPTSEPVVSEEGSPDQPSSGAQPATDNQWSRWGSLGMAKSAATIRARKRWGVTRWQDVTSEQLATLIEEIAS